MTMRRTALLIAALLAAGQTLAVPSIVSDATTVTTVTHCAWYLDSAPRQLVPAPKDTTGKPYCKLDVAGVTNGAHSITAAFVVQDATWGEQEGPKSDPFAFTRPAPPPKPSGLQAVPQ